MKKKIIAITLMIGLCLTSFTGCKKLDGIVEKGEVDVTKPIDKSDVTEGVYILTAKGKFYKPNTLNQSFTASATMPSNDRYIYSVDGSKFVPTLYKDDSLIYVSSSAIPDELDVETFDSKGYTIGAIAISEGTNGKFSVTKENTISGSDFAKQVTESSGSANAIIIIKIAGSKLEKERLTKAGTVKNLQKGNKVTVEAYAGTYYKEIKTEADTRIWVSSAISTIDNMRLTKNGYVEIQHSFAEGFYDINNEGLIRYKDENRP